MRKTIGTILFLVVLFLSFIPVIMGEYRNNLNDNYESVTVILDAGHGGKDGGASSESGIIEKEVVLSVTKKVEDYLKMQGINVVLTRDGDYDLASPEAKKRKTEDLSKRVQIMNGQENGIVVSIHANAITNSSWSGAQTFYDPKKIENKQLATAIMNSMKNNLQTTTREAKAISSLFILKNSNVPSTLVEIGFLSNPEEEMRLKSEEHQNLIVEGIVKGIDMYFDENIEINDAA